MDAMRHAPILAHTHLWPAAPTYLPTPAEGKFPAGMCAKDFIKLEAADAVPDESGWTDQETLLLLEGAPLGGRAGGWVGGCVFDCLDLLAEWPSILWPC